MQSQTDTDTDTDRRKERRQKVNCRCWLEQDTVTLFGTVTNLSHEGFFLRTLPVIDEGVKVEIKLNLEQGIVQAMGRVKWRHDSPNAPKEAIMQNAPGLGIQLIELQSGSELLRRFLKAN